MFLSQSMTDWLNTKYLACVCLCVCVFGVEMGATMQDFSDQNLRPLTFLFFVFILSGVIFERSICVKLDITWLLFYTHEFNSHKWKIRKNTLTHLKLTRH